jgi:Zn-finger protein
MENYKFFQNKNCEYFPCHRMIDKLNCLFCFCPLYHHDDCGGRYTFTDKGIKDCSGCTFPHSLVNYDFIMKKIKEYNEKKKQELILKNKGIETDKIIDKEEPNKEESHPVYRTIAQDPKCPNSMWTYEGLF